jgi:hypothetical protein
LFFTQSQIFFIKNKIHPQENKIVAATKNIAKICPVIVSAENVHARQNKPSNIPTITNKTPVIFFFSPFLFYSL